jgi:hypothetical protein
MAGAVREFLGRSGYDDLVDKLGIEGESEEFVALRIKDGGL